VRVLHLRLRRLLPVACTVLRALSVGAAAAPMVTPGTIAQFMVTRTRRGVRGTIIGPLRTHRGVRGTHPSSRCIGFIGRLMLTQATSRCVGFIGRFTVTQATSRGFIGQCLQRTDRCLPRTGHFIVPWRSGVDVSGFPERCG
jgi:hypothetical protein